MTPRRNGFLDGELVVQNGLTEDVPPDVYRFRIQGNEVYLCLSRALQRGRGTWGEGTVPFIEDGICEDCGNDG